MGSFNASLKTIGDTKGIPATVRLDEGRLSIAAGEAEIGSWPLEEIGLEPTPKGYRLAAEGEQVLIEMSDPDRFADALSEATPEKPKLTGLKVPRLLNRSKKGDEAPTKGPDTQMAAPERLIPGEQSRRVAAARSETPVREETPADDAVDLKAKRKKEHDGNAAVALLDRIIDSTEKRWGPLLPGWVFNRIVFVAAAVAVILAFVFRGFTSIALVISGVLTLMLGGAAYTDDVMASKMLPGRATPTHVLVVGIGLLLIGIGFGLIA